MARTKMEVDALVSVITKKIKEERSKVANSKDTKNKVLKLYKQKGIDKLLADRKKLEDQLEKINTRLRAVSGEHWNTAKQTVLDGLTKKVLKFKSVDVSDIHNAIVLAGDEGADIMIRNIVKQFV
jgi:hypothetical protein